MAPLPSRYRDTLLPHHSRQRCAGLTLLELMVAMTILTLIFTSAFGALRLGERSWEAALTRANDTARLRTVSGLLQRQFNQMLPITWIEDAETYLAFTGTEAQLRFIAPAPQHGGATGLFEFRLALEELPGGASLVLYFRLHDPDRTRFTVDASNPQRVVLVDQLEAASFAYYGSPRADDPAQWHARWSSKAERYPRLVRARLTRHSGQRAWPELHLSIPAAALR